jgi:hypothetical protein
VIERLETFARVLGAGGVAQKRVTTVGRVGAASCIVLERTNTGGGVVVAGYAVNGCVAKERLKTIGRVVGAGGVPGLPEVVAQKERLASLGQASAEFVHANKTVPMVSGKAGFLAFGDSANSLHLQRGIAFL